MKLLILFYSYGGNTRQIAKLVQQETGGDLCEIEIATPYTGSYNDVVDQGQREVNSGFTPKLKPVSADLKNYDTVILGTPVWWYTYAPAMRTLLQSSDFSGKVIYRRLAGAHICRHCRSLPRSHGKGRAEYSIQRRPSGHTGG
ncbi:flavodoxin [Ruminococcus callidus]|uniref:flavodoxin n=1 Tax=Ruminococcus callidus TaxID=40519 RepID=UPI00266CB337|nr:flavodoxin [uncultured Ruminococcus sp.]